jgi:hypothetical protein
MMGTMKPWVITACLVVMVAGIVAFACLRNSSLSEAFDSVNVGDSEQQVVARMGKPSWSERSCGKDFGQPGLPSGCAHEFLYRNSFAPLVPEYWSVSFDKEGRVIGKSDYVSP